MLNATNAIRKMLNETSKKADNYNTSATPWSGDKKTQFREVGCPNIVLILGHPTSQIWSTKLRTLIFRPNRESDRKLIKPASTNLVN
jgi:hypothetical protein